MPMHYTSFSFRNKSAFTVLEILLALAIVLLLVVLLFPVLNQIFTKVDDIRCQTNLSKIGVALHQYMADHDGEYPPGRANNPRGNPTIGSQLADYIAFESQPDHSTKEAGAWYCPADKERSIKYSSSSYGVNQALGADARTPENPNAKWYPWNAKPVAHEGSGNLIYIIDHDLNTTPKRTAGSFTAVSWPLQGGVKTQSIPADSNGVHFRHRGHANALFVDGSVRIMTFEDLVNTKNLYVTP